jgi:hypothetical protein
MRRLREFTAFVKVGMVGEVLRVARPYEVEPPQAYLRRGETRRDEVARAFFSIDRCEADQPFDHGVGRATIVEGRASGPKTETPDESPSSLLTHE